MNVGDLINVADRQERLKILIEGTLMDRIEQLEEALEQLTMVCTCSGRNRGDVGHADSCVSEIALTGLAVREVPR